MAAIDNNLNAFKLLFEIETAVREFLIMRCEKDIGIDWFESVFPKVVVDKSKTIGAQGNKNWEKSSEEKRAIEDKKSWFSRLIVHPIYYLDFTHLAEGIQMNSNTGLDQIFLRRNRKDICENLNRLNVIRNAVAHNRMITEMDCKTVKQVHELIRTEIGGEMFDRLAGQPPSQIATQSEMSELVTELKEASKAIESSTEFKLKKWPVFKYRWWLKPEWQLDADSVLNAFTLVEKYIDNRESDFKGHIKRADNWRRQYWNSSIFDRALASLQRDNDLTKGIKNGEESN
jgi:hypothetical protein